MAAPTDEATSFTYTTYIRATPERVWQALTDPADTARYWRPAGRAQEFGSDWKTGSTWDLLHEDVGLVVHDPEQVILESDPPARLAYTWHSVTPEWAAEVGMDDATAATWHASRARRCRSTSRRAGPTSSSSRSSMTGSSPAASCSPPSPKAGPPSCRVSRPWWRRGRRCARRRPRRDGAGPPAGVPSHPACRGGQTEAVGRGRRLLAGGFGTGTAVDARARASTPATPRSASSPTTARGRSTPTTWRGGTA